MSEQSDRALVKRAYTDVTLPELRESLTFTMAEQRLAAIGLFWRTDARHFVRVAN